MRWRSVGCWCLWRKIGLIDCVASIEWRHRLLCRCRSRFVNAVDTVISVKVFYMIGFCI